MAQEYENIWEQENSTAAVDLSMDWDSVFAKDTQETRAPVSSIPDALILSITNLGRVDVPYIAALAGVDSSSAISALKGSIYQNPDTWEERFDKGWETSEEYLSGNLKRKLTAARKAEEKYPGHFGDNIAAIEKVLPPSIAAEDIYVTLGSPWVPPDIIDRFIFHLFGRPSDRYWTSEEDPISREEYQTRHDEITGTWEIPRKSRYHPVWDGYRRKDTMKAWYATRETYGTRKMEALYLLEKTLNMRPVTITHEIRSNATASGKKRVIDKEETVALLERQKLLIDAFQKWVWQDPERAERLKTIFEDKFCCVRRRIFNGSFLTFPSMDPSVQLYPYQKDAVARILFTPNTLLAHDVGSGKTYVMIAAGQELRRMGLAKKNMYVVPNNIIGQWRRIFLSMYPDARLLCVEPKNFTPAKRQSTLAQMRDGDYDGIIIAYSCFERIPISKDYQVRELEEEEQNTRESYYKKGKRTDGLKRRLESLQRELSQLTAAPNDSYADIYFDQLGIHRLFVDEAHNFKNVPIDTKIGSVLGISSAGSKKCQDMLDKVRIVQKANDGKGVVFATGTPITNSITDAYIMQRYLQSGELAMLDLQSFDSWVGMFAEKTTDFEIDVDTSTYRMATRFAKFHNLPELTALLSSIADFHQVDASAGIPRFDGYTDALIRKTPEFAAYLKEISRRADDVRNGRIRRTEDNMLKITTDGRKAALDMRLIEEKIPYTPQCKAARCAETVADIYFRTAESRSTQLIFCDTSTPKAAFNLYDELKDRLTKLAVDPGEIAFIHDAATDAKREALFADMRKGDIRILIGSTFKLGLGVNVQDKLIALHHMDVPWRPADMTQREGRILRQGNQNKAVSIYRYITEGSFDAYSWQLLETKQRFIAALLSGSLAQRSGTDIDDTVLNYAEIKALAIGNPLMKERVEAANELSRYLTLQKRAAETRLSLEAELMSLPGRRRTLQNSIDQFAEDAAAYRQWIAEHPTPEDAPGQKEAAEQRKIIREKLHQAVMGNVMFGDETPFMTYRGFTIVLPAFMTASHPYVWLRRRGKYYVELGNTEVGNLLRVENFLEHLGDRLTQSRASLAMLDEKETAIKGQLVQKVDYTQQIETFRQILVILDKQLGVEEK